jgi:hypothetical protein
MIPKPGKKELRPLSGVVFFEKKNYSPREKIVQKALTVLIEAI